VPTAYHATIVAANAAANEVYAIIAIETGRSLSLPHVAHKHNIAFERQVL
jgi:hypothetical protein